MELPFQTGFSTTNPSSGERIAMRSALVWACSALNRALHAVFDESQVFRIDHFLDKESVDNILAFRFANGLFKPVWNRQHISYVQIDVPETLSIKGRAAFYDVTGAYRDMIVTHLFQVMAFVAMEPPVSLTAEHLRDEKEKVFEALRPIDVQHVVRGPYQGYRLRNPAWRPIRRPRPWWRRGPRWTTGAGEGVPFFLRSGKAMGASRQIVTLGFRQPPLRMFRARLPDTSADRVNETSSISPTPARSVPNSWPRFPALSWPLATPR